MFSTVPMMRLSAVVLERQKRSVLRTLGRLGAVQLTRTAPGHESAPVGPPDRSRELARCDRLLARVAEIRRSLGMTASAQAAAPAMTFEDAERNLALWEARAHAWTRRHETLQRRLDELQSAVERLEPYQALELPLDQSGQSSFLHFATGWLPLGALQRLNVGASAAVLPLPIRQGRQPMIAVTTRPGKPVLEAALRQTGFQPEALPVVARATARGLFDESRREQERLRVEVEKLYTERQALATAAAEPLAEIAEWAGVERRLFEAEQFFPGTEASALITGWIPAHKVKEAQEQLLACTGGCCAIDVSDPKDVPKREIPVLLRHRRLLRPFEILVTAYGLPQYGELAPTLFVGASYVLMFGMMFGDAGHGGILVLLGAALLWSGRTSRIRDGAVLLLANGLASATFGVAYGSYFGLPQLKSHALWRDPLEGDPMALMLLAIGIGVVLMSVGLALNIINRLRRGELADGLLDKFGLMGVVFYWGALVLLAKSAAIQAQGWWAWALVLFLAVPITCWAVKAPLVLWRQRRAGHEAESEGMVGALTESIVGAFEGVLLYLANTISFVRLAAYAMSHAALLMATFTLAEQVRRPSASGFLLATLVVILGNAVAIVLEGIVAAVQALRLEYYEFFGKFFSGDGRPFQPFSLPEAKPG